MKIVIMDSWGGKFTNVLKKHWEDLGHTVLFNPQWEEMEDADITYFEPMDNGIVTASQENKPHKGKIFVKAIDIDVWANHHGGVKWEYVDGLITIADHITEKLMREVKLPPNVKHKQIKYGVNLDEFKLRDFSKSKDNTINLAYVTGTNRIWDVKRFDIALWLLKDALRFRPDFNYKLNVLGTYSSHAQYNDYCEHMIESLGLQDHVIWTKDRVESVNDWLEDKDLLLLPSTKEAFSFATAEAMAKGIIPVINNFRGAKNIWGDYVCETYYDMLDRVINPIKYHKPQEYRKYIADNYNETRYLQEMDEFMGIK